MDKPDINQIATGKFVDVHKVMQNVTETEQGCKEMRKIHENHKNGFSNDKGRTMRQIGAIPEHIFFHPAFRDTYFSRGQDMHEWEKNIKAFLHKFPSFLTVNKI